MLIRFALCMYMSLSIWNLCCTNNHVDMYVKKLERY